MANAGVSIYFNVVTIKLSSKIGSVAVTNKTPSLAVVYENITYSTILVDDYTDRGIGKYGFCISNFNIKSAVNVKCHLTCEGFSPLTFQCETKQNGIEFNEITLYPITIDGQIQRLSDTKQKFVDTFPTILKMADSIEDYPKMMEECVPFFLMTYDGNIFKIKEANIEAKPATMSKGYVPSDCTKLTLIFTRDIKDGYPLDFQIIKKRTGFNNFHSIEDTVFSASITGKTGDVYTINLDTKDAAYFTAIAVISCLIKNTLITLSNGTKKYVQDVTFDDELLVWDFYEGRFAKAKPMFIKKAELADEYNLCRFSDGTELGLVGSDGYHRIWNNEANEFTHTGKPETPIGTHTFNERGEMPKLISQEIIREPVEFYNIITEKHYNLFANGILTSNRWSNRYSIKDMKYVLGDERMSEEHINEMIDGMGENPVWMYNEVIN